MRYKPSASSKSKWSVEQVPLTQTKIDAVEIEFKEPYDKYDKSVVVSVQFVAGALQYNS